MKIWLALCIGLYAMSRAVVGYASCATNPLECKVSAIKDFEEFELDQYARWSWLSGYEFSGLHWNQFISVYTNIGTQAYKHNYAVYIQEFLDSEEDEDDEELEGQQKGYQTYQQGTVFVKENYQAKEGKPGDLLSVTVMAKREQGFDPEGGDWEYLQFSPQGQLLFRGSSLDPTTRAVCAGCHINVVERDRVFSTILSSSID